MLIYTNDMYLAPTFFIKIDENRVSICCLASYCCYKKYKPPIPVVISCCSVGVSGFISPFIAHI